MATKKDLVEAHAFSRRRLVTAFLSGAPGGREVEPARPGRTVVGGIALAVLLMAGAAIASVLASRTEEDWNKIGLVVSREEAAPYVILEQAENPTLVPVINITSAQLILGADVEPTYVDQEVIEDQTPAEPIGIFGAPQTLPRPTRFIQSGWTACTVDGNIRMRIASEPEVTVDPVDGLLVRGEAGFFLLARSGGADANPRARAYPLPKNVPDTMLEGLNITNTRLQAPRVPDDWLRLFPTGGPLGWESFGITGVGTPAPDPGDDLPDDAEVGEYWEDEDGSGLVLTQAGPVLLTPFAVQVYASSVVPGSGGAPPSRRDDEIPSTGLGTRVYDEALWPDDLLDQFSGEPCAQLIARPGAVPLVELASDPDPEASAEGLTESHVSVARGRGAFVRAGDFDEVTSGSAWVIDPRGEAFPLVGAETVEKLGYDEVDEPLVPDPWVKLFEQGTELSTSLALCPPSREPGDPCQELGG